MLTVATRSLRPLRACAVIAALVVSACSRERGTSASGAAEGDAGGTLVIATPGDADLLLPPLVASLQGAQVTAQLFEPLADIGDSLNTVGDAGFRPRLARSWRWSPDSLAITFALDPRARFHDGHVLRADDVRFSFDVAVDPKTGSPVAPLLAGIDSVSTPDSLTAVVHYARRAPEQFYQFVYNVLVLPKHLLGDVPRDQLRSAAFGRNPVGSGPFRFVSWRAGERIELIADTANWRGRARLDRVVWSIAPDPAAATARLLAGEADLWESLRGDALTRVAASPTLRAVAYPSMDVGYFGFNVTQPLFADRALRRALAAVLDRDAIVRNALDSAAYVAAGPAPRAIAAAPATPPGPQHDSAASVRALDSLGWRVGADGVRTKGGRPLAFSILVPTTSAIRRRLAELIQAQLQGVGARVAIEQVEPNVFVQRLATHRYDAMLNAWHADPSPAGIRQSWGSAAPGAEASSNFTGYASRSFDALLDSAAAATAPQAGRALYARAYDVLSDDAPAVWLYEARNFAGLHRRVHPAALRADAWWAHLADWTIPANERIARDRVGLRAAAP